MSSDIIQFTVPLAGVSFRARLFAKESPDVVQQVLAQLPSKSVLGHTVIAGETFWAPTRLVHLGRNNMVQRRLGAVYLNAPGQSICVTYGTITESAKVNQFAQVLEEDLHVLENIGRLVYERTIARPRHNIVEVHINRESARQGELPVSVPAAPSSSATTDGKAYWQEVKALIEEEIDRVWLEEPPEVQKVRWGVIENGAGTGQQYFTVLMHLEAYLMVVGGDVMSRFLKIAQYDDIQLPMVNRITREFLVENFDLFEFFADLGLPSMHEIGQKYSKALDTLETKEDYLDLTGTMMTYINRMHRWGYFIFPWHLGVAFPHRSPAEVLALAKIVEGKGS